jgi:Helix-turn-helix domain
MTPTHPKEGTQARRVLDILLEAKGDWIKKSYLVRTCGFTQAGARIYELENDFGWNIEHSPFTDEYGFRSYRIVQETRQLTLA